MIHDLYRHMEWADAAVWRALLRNEAAEDDKRVRDLLAHLHGTEYAFLTAWTRGAFEYRKFTATREILPFAREQHEGLARFLRNVDAIALDETMELPWARRYAADAQPTTWRDTLVQLPMHSSYHRGQVNARLREVGGEPPLVDYIAWVWSGRPEPEWPD